MTWLEKFKKEHPAMAEDYIIGEFCPYDVLVGKCPEDYIIGEFCPYDVLVGKCPEDGAGNVLECEECWNRQMPEETTEGPDRT